MADPLSISASIAGLISLAQALLPSLQNFVQDIRNHSSEFTEVVRGVRGLFHAIGPVIKRLEGRKIYTDKIVSLREGIQSCTSIFYSQCDLGGVSISFRQLEGCRKVLRDFASLLEQYNPRSKENVKNFFKAMQYSLKAGSRETLLDRLERHKSSLQLALVALSL